MGRMCVVSDVELGVLSAARTITERMREFAPAVGSEEDIRHEFAKMIDNFIDANGLEIQGRHEVVLKAGGRVDTVYARVIVEYKSPVSKDRLTDRIESQGSVLVVKQLRERFEALERNDAINPDKLFGFGTDGIHCVFARTRSGKFTVDGPLPINEHTVAKFLRSLVSLGARGKAYTPKQLTTDFGSDNQASRECVAQLYAAITTTDNPKASTLYRQWKLLFGEVCGYSLDTKPRGFEELATFYGLPKTASTSHLLFAIQTYYAVFMKLLAAEIAGTFSPIPVSMVRQFSATSGDASLLREFEKMEGGGIWKQIGIHNFLEGDLFSWYLPAQNEGVCLALRSIVDRMDDYDAATLSADPGSTQDLLKDLYHELFPQQVRHSLGEYYTPDWLANHLLGEVGYEGDPQQRLLDPACGSGTFLVEAINHAKAWFAEHRFECGYDEQHLLELILTNIVGFDLNPLAVMASRTNYLLAIRDLIRYGSSIELPVHLCDSILTPEDKSTHIATMPFRPLETSEGVFHIPTDIISDGMTIARYVAVLEDCLDLDEESDFFLERCAQEGVELWDNPDRDKSTPSFGNHRKLYDQIRTLKHQDRDGIWARIIKNQFAPVFAGRFDFVVGNPPWIQWESLPKAYRDNSQPVWRRYGLFNLTKGEGRLGGGKKDLSMLFTYVCFDHYLKDTGSLGFLITQSVFKSKDAGDGFRRFEFLRGDKTVHMDVVRVNDLTALQPFTGATTMTASFVLRNRPDPDTYPVPYIVWKSNTMTRVPSDATLDWVEGWTTRTELAAEPIRRDKPNSPWLTITAEAIPLIQRAIGDSDYQAHAGMSTWLNGVFMVKPIRDMGDGKVLVENLWDVGKKKMKSVQMVVDDDLLYPCFAGNELVRWSGVPSTHILMTQDTVERRGLAEATMKTVYFDTYKYLKEFEGELRKRSGFVKYFRSTDPFWSIFNVGDYTLSDWKVVWNRIDTRLRAAVVGPIGGKPVMPREIHTYVSVATEDEAHYLCAMVNSSVSDLIVRGYSVSKGFAGPHVLETVAIPKFDPDSELHRALVVLSKQVHAERVHGGEEMGQAIAILEPSLNLAAARVWRIPDADVAIIDDALRAI